MVVVADEAFSVDREIRNILNDGKARKSYFVFVTDTAKPRLKKTDRIVHKVQTAEFFIKTLRNKLLELEMQDMGINPKAKKVLSFLYIIDRG
ncbi:hypothetical protein ACFE6N_02730 [Pedobacter sp. BG31]|uniref:hypothetical protein n=1 Tax=Pedobacter sp. BG31 TaxID=3349697 RepID=UPI0035F2EB6C